ncbi:MAG: Gp49 family protein [Sporolactobacillus sp.]
MSANIVTQEHIDEIFEHSEIKVQTVFNKTTIVSAKLPNGFVIVESTGCVDPANYSEEIGKEICIERIKNKIWELEGYLLQDKLA